MAAADPLSERPQARPISRPAVYGLSFPPVHRWLSDEQREGMRDLNRRCRHGPCRAESMARVSCDPVRLRKADTFAVEAPFVPREDGQLVLLYADQRQHLARNFKPLADPLLSVNGGRELRMPICHLLTICRAALQIFVAPASIVYRTGFVYLPHGL